MNKRKTLRKVIYKMNNSFLKKFSSRKKKILSIWNKLRIQKEIKKTKTFNKKSNQFLKTFKKFISIKNELNTRFYNLKREISFVEIFNIKNFRINSKSVKNIIERYPDSQFLNFIRKLTIKNNNGVLSDKNNLLVNFLGIHYVDHKLSIIHLQRKNKTTFIKDFVNINAPGDLIGDFKVEKVSEVKRIIEDVINIYELDDPPIILLLGSSFFTVRSFGDNELMVFSDEDPLILSKSPFLPVNTLVQYKRVNGDKKSSYHRVVYAEKEAIDSWINVISLTNSKIATVSCSSINLIEKINEDSISEYSILCDIEENSSTILLIRNQCELDSTKLPFGSSIYISDKESLNKQFFSRLINSISKILQNKKIEFNGIIYLHGNGIDNMLALNDYVDERFKKITNYEYQINENKDLNLNNHSSILNSFSNILDILTK